MSTITLNVEDTVNAVIKSELKTIIEMNGAPFIKFQLIATSIEFLGACLDKHPFIKNEKSEERFNNALNKLFPKNYHKYAKKSSTFNLYELYRCHVLHTLRPGPGVMFTERRHMKDGKSIHLHEIQGLLFLVLEDFYDDLYKACDNLIELSHKKKLPTKKMEDSYIQVIHGTTGNTQTMMVK